MTSYYFLVTSEEESNYISGFNLKIYNNILLKVYCEIVMKILWICHLELVIIRLYNVNVGLRVWLYFGTSPIRSTRLNTICRKIQLTDLIIRRKHYFVPYILGLQLIWSLHFDSSQFGPCSF